jgi:hypothetical protein
MSVERIMEKFGCTREQAEDERRHMIEEDIMLNNVYQVNIRVAETGIYTDMVYLSIKRRDKKTIRDWRHLQRIKNELVGPECEGVELYPAESRLVDTANQYHMWVAVDSDFRFPFGFTERLVHGPEEAHKVGARQRAFEKGE